LSAEDCNPNKSLRTTIRVFLRTAEKKREASRPKEDKVSEPATPVEAPKQNLPTTEKSAIETPIEQISGGDAPSSVQAYSAERVDEGAPALRVVQVLRLLILVKDFPLTSFFQRKILLIMTTLLPLRVRSKLRQVMLRAHLPTAA
jgi:hypothetical protein